MSDPQSSAPFADGLRAMAATDWLPLHVPGHQARAAHVPGLARSFDEQLLRMDLPMSMANLDHQTWALTGAGSSTPMARSLALAAEAWGARRAWWLTNGASSGNHAACLAIRMLAGEVVVQRSMHSSVVDGLMLAGLDAHFVAPEVDTHLGSSFGLTVPAADRALRENPGSGALYVVSPSYFGAVADIPGLAEVAHAHGVPLIVDEAWGSHFGFHPGLPVNAVRAGADLVVSSTHKNAGALTQSAMLLLGQGEHAARLEAAVDRAHRSLQSTSSSALLMLSLDETRRHLATRGRDAIGRSLAAAVELRAGIASAGRFVDATDRIRAARGVVEVDPLKLVLDTSAGGISGREAHHRLLKDHRVAVEMSTATAVVLLLGATAGIDVRRLLDALHRLPVTGDGRSPAHPPLPLAPRRSLSVREAFLHPFETVPAARAVGRISADSLAAYPPGIPNVLPGEVLTRPVVDFLREIAAMPAGLVRGATDPRLDTFRVLTRKPPSGGPR